MRWHQQLYRPEGGIQLTISARNGALPVPAPRVVLAEEPIRKLHSAVFRLSWCIWRFRIVACPTPESYHGLRCARLCRRMRGANGQAGYRHILRCVDGGDYLRCRLPLLPKQVLGTVDREYRNHPGIRSLLFQVPATAVSAQTRAARAFYPRSRRCAPSPSSGFITATYGRFRYNWL